MCQVIVGLTPSRETIQLGGTIDIYLLERGVSELEMGVGRLHSPSEIEALAIREKLAKDGFVNAVAPSKVYLVEPVSEDSFKRYEEFSGSRTVELDGTPVVLVQS